MVQINRYPFTIAAKASPIPVFPDVASIIVPPGLSKPSFSASSTICTAILSLIEFPGLKVSTFAKMVPGTPSTVLFILTIGVLPIVSNMLLYHISLKLRINFGYTVKCLTIQLIEFNSSYRGNSGNYY